MNQGEEEHVVRGTVERVTYRNPENGYSVIQIAITERRERLTVVGMCLEARVGADLIVRGTYKTHPKFGKQLSASSITETPPSSPEGFERYLSSGLIKGVGPKTAERIVKKFGEKTLEIIRNDPRSLGRVRGVGRHRAELISQAFAEHEEMNETIRFMVENDISPRLAGKIYEKYKAKSAEVLKRDPYLLARQMKGIGFVTADSIAMKLGLKPDSPQRIKAGIYHALEKAADDGHCYLKGEDLSKRSRVLLGIGDDYDLSPFLDALLEEEFVVHHRDGYFLRHLHRAEEIVAGFVAHRTGSLPAPRYSESLVEQALKEVERELALTFSAEQRDAVNLANRYSLLLITGGPGCGKTTIIRALTAFFKKSKARLLLAAPTGRAAQRMSQVCDFSASTIHRLLKYDPINGGFLHGAKQPLPADAIIIDESSMIDISLARDLFSAIAPETHVILVGDRDQLPSVGPGRVFADLLSIREVKSVNLSRLFRREESSSINHIAHMINSGVVPEIPEPDGVTKTDAYFLPKKTAEESAQLIERLVSDQIPKKFGIQTEDIFVLTPSNRGPLGTIGLNTQLQNRLNPSDVKERELTVGGSTFRIGDRVCQRVNNYNIDPNGVFNGDTGIIYGINPKEKSLVVELWDGRLITYEQSDLHQLSLAYAITVHRSQGSEMPCVILALDYSHFTLLERQLFYTGVTRAKKLLIIVGSHQALALAVKRTTSTKRGTMLARRVHEVLGNPTLEVN